MAIANALAPILKQINDRFDGVTDQLQIIRSDLYEIGLIARQGRNGSVMRDDEIIPFPNRAGDISPLFPETKAALDELPGQVLETLLNHYGLSTTGLVSDKRKRFRDFLGLRL